MTMETLCLYKHQHRNNQETLDNASKQGSTEWLLSSQTRKGQSLEHPENVCFEWLSHPTSRHHLRNPGLSPLASRASSARPRASSVDMHTFLNCCPRDYWIEEHLTANHRSSSSMRMPGAWVQSCCPAFSRRLLRLEHRYLQKSLGS